MADLILKTVQGSTYHELLEDYEQGKNNLDRAYKVANVTGNFSEVYDQFYAMTELKKRIEKMSLLQEDIAKARYEGISKYKNKYASWQDYMYSDDFQNSVNRSKTIYSLNPDSSLGKAVNAIGDTSTSAIQGYAIEGATLAASLPRLAEDVIGFGVDKMYGMLGMETPEQSVPLGIKNVNGEIVPRYSTTPFDPNYSERVAQGKLLPNYEQIQRFMSQNVPGAKEAYEFEPGSRVGEYAQTIGSFATPLGIFGLPGKTQVGAAAIGGTTYEAVSGATDNPLYATTASLAAIIGGNYAVSTQRAANIAKKSLKNISKEEILVAMEIEKMANKLNIPITAAELLDSRLLDDIYKLTARSDKKAGINLESYLKNRPQDFHRVANDLLDNILKDKNLAKKLGFLDLQNMVKETQKRIKNKRSLESQQAGYSIGDDVIINKDFIQDIVRKIDIELSAGGQNPAKVKLLKDFRKSLHSGDGSVLTKTSDLSEVYKIYRDAMNARGDKALDSVLRTLLSNPNTKDGIWDGLEKALKTNKQWVAGNKRYEEMSKLVDESFAYLKFADDTIDMDKIKKLIFDTDNVNVKDIQKLAAFFRNNVTANKNLVEQIGPGNKTLPYVNYENPFSTFVDLYMRNLFNKTFTPVSKGSKGKFKADAGFNFNKELFPIAAARQNFDEILRQVALEQGKNPKDLITGWNNFSKIAEKTGQNVGGPMQKTSPTVASHLLRLGSFMYRVSLGRMLDKSVDTAALETFSKIFTSPNSVEGLVQLSKQPNNIKAVNAIIGVTAYQQGTTTNADNFMSLDEYNILSDKLIQENNLKVKN